MRIPQRLWYTAESDIMSLNHWEQVNASDFACFDRNFKLLDGFSDPGGYLARCGEAIVKLTETANRYSDEKNEHVSHWHRMREERDLFEKLSRAVQSETEKALIRRCGELEAENLLLRAGVGVIPDTDVEPVEPDDSDKF